METSSFQALKSISFGIFTNEQIRSLSVLEITNTEILDNLGHPAPDGLHDLRLGPNEKDDFCATCGLNFFKCPGHLGHITLPVPVYNPVFFPQLYQILRGSCLNCHRLLAPESQLCLARYQLQALDYGLVSTVEELAEVITDASEEIIRGENYSSVVKEKLKNKFEEAIQGLSAEESKPVKSVVECRRKILKNFIKKNMMGVTGKCPHCKMPRKKLTRYNMRIVYVENKNARSSTSFSEYDSEMISSELSNKEILPEDARKHLHLLWQNDKIFLQNLFKILQKDDEAEVSVDMFFMDLIMVPPSKFRRLNVMKGRKYADSQTVLFSEIIKDCHALNNIVKFIKNVSIDDNAKDAINKLPGKTNGDKFNFLYQALQKHVNELFDSDTNKSRTKLSKGIKQHNMGPTASDLRKARHLPSTVCKEGTVLECAEIHLEEG